MKSNLFKSIITILFALMISQPSILAQTNQSTRYEAQLKLYDIVKELSDLQGVDFGGIQYENISYDCETLQMDIRVNTSQSDIRYLTSDMLTLQIHNLVNTPTQKEYYVILSSLLRQADSKWQITYKDAQGHAVSHILSADDIDSMIDKPIEELGIDKEQMSNYCIFFHNNLFQRQVDGVEVLAIKASKAGDFVKIAIQTTYDNETIKRLTPQLIKTTYISSYKSPVLAEGYANQLKALGYKGIIFEYTNQQGTTAEATLTLDDLRNFYDDTSDTEESIEMDGAAIEDITIYDDEIYDSCVVAYDTIYSLDQNPIIQDRLIAYDIEHKKGIGIDGIVDAYVTLSGEYFEFTEILDEITDNASNYSQSFKDLMLNIFAQDEENLNEIIYLYNNGLNGFTYTFINRTNKKKFSTTIDFLEVFEAAKDYGFEIGEASNGSNLDNNLESMSEEEKQAYATIFMQQLDESISNWIGSDGVINTHTYIVKDYINIICTVNSIEGYSDDFINQCKINYIKQVKPQYNEELVHSLKYILEVKGYNFIYTDAYSHKSVSMIIDFDEILNFSDDSQFNDNYDFSDINTEEIVNELVSFFGAELKSNVGQDGLLDVNTTLSNKLIESTFIFDSSININDVGDINDFKNELIRDMTDTQDDLDTWGALYYLGIDGFKFIFKNQGSASGKWFSITIEDVINGIENIDAIPLNEI
ncbi:MAG: hypothetical protein IKV83_04050 [Muribaculaceae bacterium]|nr:hypothetical protein [Muribaculaceae bacterium]